MWLSVLNKYKAYLIGVALAAILVISANIYVGRKETESYNKGYEEANSAWMKKGQQYVGMIDEAYDKNKALNAQLQIAAEKNRKLEEERGNKVKDQLIKYANSADAKNKSLSNDFVDIYNNSLGD